LNTPLDHKPDQAIYHCRRTPSQPCRQPSLPYLYSPSNPATASSSRNPMLTPWASSMTAASCLLIAGPSGSSLRGTGLNTFVSVLILHYTSPHQISTLLFRNNAAAALIRPIINHSTNTLDISAPSLEPISIPLNPDPSISPKLSVRLWADVVDVYDMGDIAAEWATAFFTLHPLQNMSEDVEAKDKEGEDKGRIRLVKLTGVEGGYNRPAHPKIPGIHTPLADDSPVSLGFEASAEELNKILERPEVDGKRIPINRFRNNLTIAGTLPWEEDNWLVVRIGTTTFYILRPIDRCAVPGINQETAVKDEWGTPGPLRVLKQYHSFPENPNAGYFCLHAMPLTAGKIKVGDEVVVLEWVPKKDSGESTVQNV
ncbi:MOSC domain-containing protein, partial [Endogone sp. FLAS-F59071]